MGNITGQMYQVLPQVKETNNSVPKSSVYTLTESWLKLSSETIIQETKEININSLYLFQFLMGLHHFWTTGETGFENQDGVPFPQCWRLNTWEMPRQELKVLFKEQNRERLLQRRGVWELLPQRMGVSSLL